MKSTGIVQSIQYMYVIFYKTQEYDHFPLRKISVSIADGQIIPYRPAVWAPLQVYAEKIKSETDLRKMVKIMEELLKIKKKR